MKLRTRVFELYNAKYASLPKLARAMEMAASQIYRVREGKRPINEKFIIGAMKAFPRYKLGDLFYVAPDGSQAMTITETAHQQDLDAFLKEVMRRKKRLSSQMAADLGVSHATVSRWLSGEDKPSTESCRKLADYSGESLQKIFSLAGHMPGMEQPISSNLPEFREYVRSKYPNKLDEDVITIIENIIERTRGER